MNNFLSKRATRNILIGLLIIIAIYIIVVKKDSWTLSLYGGGNTLLRIETDSLESCQKIGFDYFQKGSIDRYDCGLNCSKTDSLKNSIVCDEVIR